MRLPRSPIWSSSSSSRSNCGFSTCVWLAVLLMLATVDLTRSSGQMNVQFLRFSSGGRTAAGVSCDAVGAEDQPCDPQFRVTAEREMKGGESIFVYQQTGYYSNRVAVDFVSAFGEMPNPLVIGLNYSDNQGGLWIEVSVTDIDSDNSGELMSKFTAQLQASGTETRYLELKSETNQSLTLRYWYSCSASYYGSLCNKLCLDSNDNDYGHGWCDSNGDKFCRYGWVDVSTGCRKPHPCRTCVCQNGGTCVPQGEDGYRCQCASGFYGGNCDKCHLGQCGKSSQTDSSCDLMPAVPIQQNAVGGIGAGAAAAALAGAAMLGSIVTGALCCRFRRRGQSY